MNKNKSLLLKFIEFNAAKRLAGIKKETLLTVSGGIDSVVMCDLFRKAEFPFAIAHCNFQLRDKESDADEKLVQELAEKYKVQFFAKKFDTSKFAAKKNISIQVAARELRYEWFEQLRVENKFNLIATAHHLNDNIETILFNLIKGSGIRGLRGIPVRQGNIIRPMLFATRNEIEEWQETYQLEFREDSSNREDKYTRNMIRHQIVPLLREINPSLESAFAGKVELFNRLETMYEQENKKLTKQLFLPRAKDIYIPILKLRKLAGAFDALFEFLKEYGFNSTQIEDIRTVLDAVPGKQFLSSEARLIKDRRFLILTRLADTNFALQFIHEKDQEIILGNRKLKLAIIASEPGTQKTKEKSKTPEINADPNCAFLDKSKLEFPLTIRIWKPGDYFYPLGMKMKKKKLKKFFTDEKIPLHEKENSWVIESNKRIVWVAGHRIDERFKVTKGTKEIWKMTLK